VRQAVSRKAIKARRSAIEAGQLDEHWLELSHVLSDVNAVLPGGKEAYFDAMECEAEALS
jgi:hypothetical protein